MRKIQPKRKPMHPRVREIWERTEHYHELLKAAGAVGSLLIALLSFVVSAWSISQAREGIALAQKGIQLTQATIDAEDEKTLVDRTPFLTFTIENYAIGLSNDGYGPADIYRVDVKAGDKFFHFTRENSDDEIAIVHNIWAASVRKDVPESIPLADVPPYLRSAVRVLKKDDEFKFLSFAPKDKAEYDDEKFRRYVRSLSLRACATDLLGKTKIAAVSGSYQWPDCPTPTALISISRGVR
ncbi:hypothetical protein AMC83_PA00050 (plasmid) [Rhizobium phaseoli]|uniref:hypothetical protein n=1 Tax=Rhizobium phaseoli TaxID=396 RepID=UPI0007EA3B1B|nr:hypothetical protein [Rhizobium phaseoli]ANL74277.1 hypothetical protein AMC83_PA00050 [Rhizobium phaseoli]